MADISTSTPTPILAMHARYEQAVEAQHQLDIADLALGRGEKDQTLSNAYSIGAGMADAEADALRRAILYQVPANATDAAILQHHVYISIDLFGREAPEVEHNAIIVGIDTLFDYLASELPKPTEQIGREFHRGVERVWQRRRLRNGDVEA